MSQYNVGVNVGDLGSTQGDYMYDLRQGLPPVNQGMSPQLLQANQQPLPQPQPIQRPENRNFDEERYRTARRNDYEDFEEQLVRDYFEGNNRYDKPPREEEVRLTMRGLPRSSASLAHSDHYRQPTIPGDPKLTMRSLYTQDIDEFLETYTKEPVRNSFVQHEWDETKELKKIVEQLREQNAQLMEENTQLRAQQNQQGPVILELMDARMSLNRRTDEAEEALNEFTAHLTQIASAISMLRDSEGEDLEDGSMELNEGLSSVEFAQVSRTKSRTSPDKKTCATQTEETCATCAVNDLMFVHSNPLFCESIHEQDSMGMSNEELDQELWELFSKVETLLGEKVAVETEGEVVNVSSCNSIQPSFNNAGVHVLYSFNELKPLPKHAKAKDVGKRKRSPRKQKSSKAQEVHYKKNVGKVPTQISFGQVHHLPVKVKRNSFWIAKSCNFTLTNVGLEKELRLAQLRELRQRDKENHQDYKARAKAYYKKLGVTTWSIKPGKPVIQKFDLKTPWDPNL